MVQPVNNPDIHDALRAFLAEWHSDSPTVTVQTSGSTGTPKRMEVEKTRMEASARLTCDFLDLHPGDTALLCMPLQYIAGKMVVVRSLVRGLRLVTVQPCGHPLAGLEDAPVFAAMIPMQVYNSLQVPRERALLRQVKHLIIGGGAIDTPLAEALRDFPNAVWSTYGMTETLSHIALRRLNGPDASEWYTPFASVSIRLSERGTLVIQAPRSARRNSTFSTAKASRRRGVSSTSAPPATSSARAVRGSPMRVKRSPRAAKRCATG